MKISNERRKKIEEDFMDAGYMKDDEVVQYWLNILDQELSNHTQRIIDEIWARPTYPDQDGCFVRDCILELPSLQTNPTKDNDTTQ